MHMLVNRRRPETNSGARPPTSWQHELASRAHSTISELASGVQELGSRAEFMGDGRRIWSWPGTYLTSWFHATSWIHRLGPRGRSLVFGAGGARTCRAGPTRWAHELTTPIVGLPSDSQEPGPRAGFASLVHRSIAQISKLAAHSPERRCVALWRMLWVCVVRRRTSTQTRVVKCGA